MLSRCHIRPLLKSSHVKLTPFFTRIMRRLMRDSLLESSWASQSTCVILHESSIRVRNAFSSFDLICSISVIVAIVTIIMIIKIINSFFIPDPIPSLFLSICPSYRISYHRSVPRKILWTPLLSPILKILKNPYYLYSSLSSSTLKSSLKNLFV